MSNVIGIDCSTTATKAVVVDRQGQVVGVGTSEYGYDTPRPGWSEQDPSLWWNGTVEAIRRVLASTAIDGASVDAVGLTGQMHGSVLLDRRANVLRPALLWNDQRTTDEVDELRHLLGDRLIEITGNDAMTGFTAPKLLWVRRHEPEVWAEVAHVLLPKDYVRLRLTGGYATDVAGGSGTQLFDVGLRTWSTEMTDALDLDPAWFPPTHEGPTVTGTVTAEAGTLTGLTPGTPVVAGGGDQAANAVGVGAIDPGVMALSLGTSGVVFAATDRPMIETRGRVHSFCHAVPDRWHLMGVMLSAAGSLRWFRDTLAPGDSFAELSRDAEGADSGSEGLLFLPYLTGERTPHADPHARGAFVGLTIRHGRGHMVRAIMEGVAFGLRDSLDLMLDTGLAAPTRIHASGGGMNSPVWRQILADTLDTEIVTTNTAEGAAFGAALLATVGAGWYRSVSEVVADVVELRPAAAPGPHRQLIAARHRRYRDLYPALRPFFSD